MKWPVPHPVDGVDFNEETITDGLRIRVYTEKMVERVFVAPSAPDWFAELVRAVVIRYGYNFDVVQSRLDEQPIF
jgi:hypothetical protein